MTAFEELFIRWLKYVYPNDPFQHFFIDELYKDKKILPDTKKLIEEIKNNSK